MTGDLTISSLKVAQQGFRGIQDNLSNAGVPQSHRIDHSVIANYGVKGDFFGVKSLSSRATNEYLSKSVRESVTKASKADVIVNSLLSLEASMANGPDSRLIKALSEFTSKISTLIVNNDPSMRESFLLLSKELAGTISQSASKINELRFQADKDLSSSVTIVNNIIRNLAEINKGISRAGDAGINLHNNRDLELNKLSEYFDISVNFGKNGEALVRGKDGTEIVGMDNHAQLHYTPLASIASMLMCDKINPITLSYSKQYQPITVIDNGVNKITGGKFEGLIKLRDEVLPEFQSKLQSFTKAFVDGFNRIHNMGSTFPPKTKIKGTKEIALSDSINFTGKSAFSIVDGNGRPVNGGSGKIKPLTIDFDNLAKKDGRITTKELLEELNAQLSYAPTQDRLRLGQILDHGGVAIPNQSLLNDIKIRGKSDIENGNFTFDLDLDGNELFGSIVEVLEVSVGGVAIQENQLPSSFRLGKGQHLCTNQSINIGGIVAGPQDIRIKLRVTGENGVVQEGSADFAIDPANASLSNKRISGLIPGANGIGIAIPGNQMVQGGATHASFVRAKLVDENGAEITDDSGKKGHLVIESISDDCRLVMQEGTSDDDGKGFKHFFGFNDFFGLKDDGTVEALIQKPEDLSIGTVKKSTNSVKTNVKVGGVGASAEMAFTGGNVPVAGTDVIIDGVTYHFVAVLTGNPREVLVDGGGILLNDLHNLINNINTTRSLSSKIEASINLANNGIVITAINAGESGNAIQIQASIQTNINAILVAGGVNDPLIGGTNIDRAVETDYFEIGNDSKQILELFSKFDKNNINMSGYEGTIHDCASTMIGMISNQTVAAKNEYKVSKEVITQLDKQLKSEVGIDKNAERMKLQELAEYYQANTAAMRYYRRLWDDFLNMINR